MDAVHDVPDGAADDRAERNADERRLHRGIAEREPEQREHRNGSAISSHVCEPKSPNAPRKFCTYVK